MRQLIYVFVLMLFFGCHTSSTDHLVIASAANMEFALRELIESFQKKEAIPCELVIGSSGKLTAQIAEGAPYDVFLSADMKYPQKLFEKGISDKVPEQYAAGKLVYWTINESMDLNFSPSSVQQFEHIAIANPKIAPYGKAALEVLRRREDWEQLENKLVYGESISQVNQFVILGVAEVGITSKSSLFTPGIKNKGSWLEIDEDLYTSIAQGAVILNRRSNQQEKAKKFYDFLFSSEGKEILNKFGYSTLE